MKVLHFLGRRRLPPDPDAGSTGGISRVALELARAQRDLGHETCVAATGPVAWEGEWRGVRILTVTEPVWVPSVSFAGKMANARTHTALVRLSRRRSFDVVHGHEAPYLRFVRAGLRLSHIHNNPFWTEHQPAQWQVQAAEFRVLGRRSDLRIAVSEFVARQVREGTVRILGASPDAAELAAVHVVRNGVDLERFAAERTAATRVELRGSWGVGDEEVVFLYAGAIARDKGVDHLARAFADLAGELPRTRLVLAGGAALWGNNFDVQAAAASEYEVNVRDVLRPAGERGQVRWLGVTSARGMPGVYAAADVLVVPSLQEACPLVVLEGLASGLPIVASRVGGVPELASAGNALLVPPADSGALTDAMRRLAADPALRRQLGQGAWTAARGLTWHRAAEELDRIYSDAHAT